MDGHIKSIQLLRFALSIVLLAGLTAAYAADSDLDGVPDSVDPAPNDVLVTGYQPSWLGKFSGESVNDLFGQSVSSAGDVNNDGHMDVIVGAPYDDNNGDSSGSARIFSGVNGTLLYTFNGDSANDFFGSSVSGAGDVNKDGYADVIVGTPYDDSNGQNSGSARILSGADGAILYTLNGDSANDLFGNAVSDAGDVNNDGYADVIVGAYQDDNHGTNSGSARIFSGANGSILYTFNGDNTGDSFGWSVRNAGDVNLDGYSDIIVGAYQDDNNGLDSGMARIFSGANGTILRTLNGDGAGDHFGYAVSNAGDINKDGKADVVVGAYKDDNNGTDSGSIRVFNGANGAIIYTFNGDNAGDYFGYTVSAAGDVNKDGYPDVIVGAYKDDDGGGDAGSARIFSGANGSILYSYNGDSAGDLFGYTVSAAGDVDKDGYADVIVGAYQDDGKANNGGSAYIFSGAAFLQQTADTDADDIVNTMDPDDDNDGMSDIWEALHRFNLLLNEGQAATDLDGDGLSNLQESLLNSNPNSTDTDLDGISDAKDPAPTDGLVTGYHPPWIATFNGDSAGDQFGYVVSGAGDVNKDGYADVVIGAWQDDNNGSNSGSAHIFSGSNSAILYTFYGDSTDDYFGRAVSGAGDVNRDGYADVIVGAHGDDNNGSASGSARIFSGANGSILYTFNGDSAADLFGSSVSGAGDVNDDGYADVIVGAFQDDNNGNDSGSAHIFSGANGETLYTFNGDSAEDYFGWSVSGAGDVNRDGYADVIVGAYGDDNTSDRAGSARIFSGANGEILYTFDGDSANDKFGDAVSAAGDVNNDGYTDVIVGAPQDDNNGDNSGSARIFSGINGSLLYTFNGDNSNDLFGTSVSGAGDVNKDGYTDVIVGAYSDDNNGDASGSARIFSGANGTILYTFNGDNLQDYFGIAASGAGDVNNDGYADLIVGAYYDDNNGNASGSARLFSGAMFLQQVTDTDSDGAVNTMDIDDDNDSITDETDNFPIDTDNDAINNIDDPDDDGDNIPDYIDAEPLNAGIARERTLLLNTPYRGSSVRENTAAQ